MILGIFHIFEISRLNNPKNKCIITGENINKYIMTGENVVILYISMNIIFYVFIT